MSDICSQCSGEYQRLGQHWHMSSCSYPSFTDRQHGIITGVLMGDGSVQKSGQRLPRLKCSMVTEEYLEYLAGVFPETSCGVRLERTAEEEADRDRDRGMSDEPGNYRDLYRLMWRGNPEFEQYRSWYDGGSKVWPGDLDLTPLTLKHWYAGDGTYSNKKEIRIALSNEINNKEKVGEYFTERGLPEPKWDESKREYGGYRANIRFRVEESKQLFEYMGDPLPGFEYKWP